MNTRYVLTLCTALVIGGALLTGSANALGKADEKTPINDSWLTSKTKIALFADARVKGSEINVETKRTQLAAELLPTEVARVVDLHQAPGFGLFSGRDLNPSTSRVALLARRVQPLR